MKPCKIKRHLSQNCFGIPISKIKKLIVSKVTRPIVFEARTENKFASVLSEYKLGNFHEDVLYHWRACKLSGKKEISELRRNLKNYGGKTN